MIHITTEHVQAAELRPGELFLADNVANQRYCDECNTHDAKWLQACMRTFQPPYGYGGQSKVLRITITNDDGGVIWGEQINQPITLGVNRIMAQDIQPGDICPSYNPDAFKRFSCLRSIGEMVTVRCDAPYDGGGVWDNGELVRWVIQPEAQSECDRRNAESEAGK